MDDLFFRNDADKNVIQGWQGNLEFFDMQIIGQQLA